MNRIDVLDHGFVRLVDSMGSDLSARYRELPEEIYMPEFRKQSQTNKQGSDGMVHDHGIANLDLMFRNSYRDAFEAYRFALSQGVAREVARSVLPVATYSHMFCTVNLLNLFRFLTLRCDGHAQYEIRIYADAMLELIRPVVPVCVSAWEKSTTDGDPT